jgi:hypothetical protein
MVHQMKRHLQAGLRGTPSALWQRRIQLVLLDGLAGRVVAVQRHGVQVRRPGRQLRHPVGQRRQRHDHQRRLANAQRSGEKQAVAALYWHARINITWRKLCKQSSRTQKHCARLTAWRQRRQWSAPSCQDPVARAANMNILCICHTYTSWLGMQRTISSARMTLWRVRHALTSLQHQERGFADSDGMQSMLLVTLRPFHLGETSQHHSRCPPVEAFQLIGVQSAAVQKVRRLLELAGALLRRQRPLLVSCRWLATSPQALVRLSSRLAGLQGPQTSCKSAEKPSSDSTDRIQQGSMVPLS